MTSTWSPLGPARGFVADSSLIRQGATLVIPCQGVGSRGTRSLVPGFHHWTSVRMTQDAGITG